MSSSITDDDPRRLAGIDGDELRFEESLAQHERKRMTADRIPDCPCAATMIPACATCDGEGEVSVPVTAFVSEVVPCPDCQSEEIEVGGSDGCIDSAFETEYELEHSAKADERNRIRTELIDWLVGTILPCDAGLINGRRIVDEIDRICPKE